MLLWTNIWGCISVQTNQCSKIRNRILTSKDVRYRKPEYYTYSYASVTRIVCFSNICDCNERCLQETTYTSGMIKLWCMKLSPATFWIIWKWHDFYLTFIRNMTGLRRIIVFIKAIWVWDGLFAKSGRRKSRLLKIFHSIGEKSTSAARQYLATARRFKTNIFIGLWPRYGSVLCTLL